MVLQVPVILARNSSVRDGKRLAESEVRAMMVFSLIFAGFGVSVENDVYSGGAPGVDTVSNWRLNTHWRALRGWSWTRCFYFWQKLVRKADPLPEPKDVPFSAQAVADGYWEVYHDDDCGQAFDWFGGTGCPKCGFRPDMQSIAARKIIRKTDSQ